VQESNIKKDYKIKRAIIFTIILLFMLFCIAQAIKMIDILEKTTKTLGVATSNNEINNVENNNTIANASDENKPDYIYIEQGSNFHTNSHSTSGSSVNNVAGNDATGNNTTGNNTTGNNITGNNTTGNNTTGNNTTGNNTAGNNTTGNNTTGNNTTGNNTTGNNTAGNNTTGNNTTGNNTTGNNTTGNNTTGNNTTGNNTTGNNTTGNNTTGNNTTGNNTTGNNTTGNNTTGNNTTGNNTTANNTTENNSDTTGFYIKDNDYNWADTTQLHIFKDITYNYRELIVPGSIGTYNFVVVNANDFKLNLDMQFIENNLYNVNMKYRLKQGNGYIIGNANTWVSASDLNIQNAIFEANEQREYTLEWKWVESANDTSIGITSGAKYQLSIQYYAEEIL